MSYEEMIYWLKKALECDSFGWKPIPDALKMAIEILENQKDTKEE